MILGGGQETSLGKRTFDGLAPLLNTRKIIQIVLLITNEGSSYPLVFQSMES